MVCIFDRPERKRLRLAGYDYSKNGYYFVTVCTKNKIDFFGKIRNGIMGLNEIGCVVAKCWQEILEHFKNVKLDEWQIMPNHFHGILVIDKPDDDFGLFRKPVWNTVGDADLRPLQTHMPVMDRTKMLLPKIIHGFKSSVTRFIRRRNIHTSFGWQRSYYDHIIRNEKSLNHICEYIQYNPLKWEMDAENRKNKFSEEQIKRHYDSLFIK